MHSEDSELEVFIIPVGNNELLAVPTGDLDAPAAKEWSKIASTFTKAGLLATTALDVLGGVNKQNAALFEMSPDSYRQYKGARLDEVGGFFRAVLRTQQGQTSHQVQLRAVQPTQVPVGATMIAAAQMIAIQAQLDRIEDTLATLTASVSEIMQFLENQQRAEIDAVICPLRQILEHARVTRKISDTDWQRVANFEFVLGKQLGLVKDELQNRLKIAEFGDTPEADHQRMNEIDPDRVAELARYYWLLSGGVRGWTELLALRKYQEGELTGMEVSAIKSRLKKIRIEQENILNTIGSVVSAAGKAKPRSRINMWLSNGEYRGGRKDKNEHLPAIKKGRDALELLYNDLAVALPTSFSPGLLVTSEDGATYSGETTTGLQAQNGDGQREGR